MQVPKRVTKLLLDKENSFVEVPCKVAKKRVDVEGKVFILF